MNHVAALEAIEAAHRFITWLKFGKLDKAEWELNLVVASFEKAKGERDRIPKDHLELARTAIHYDSMTDADFTALPIDEQNHAHRAIGLFNGLSNAVCKSLHRKVMAEKERGNQSAVPVVSAASDASHGPGTLPPNAPPGDPSGHGPALPVRPNDAPDEHAGETRPSP